MVSVIIPTYNRGKVITRSIDSVLNQTYKDLELIIVDDCSTDNTQEIVRQIDDPRVTYICLEENQGACVARNVGIAKARGEVIAFQDSDDEWHCDKLAVQIEVMKKTNADVCFCKVRRYYDSIDIDDGCGGSFPDLQGSRFMSHEDMCNKACISTQTILAWKKVFEEHLFDSQVRKAQDYDWGIRASRNHSFYFLDDILVDQYIQKDSLSAAGLKAVKQSRQYFLEKYQEEFADNKQFEIYQLKVLVRAKALLNENAKVECVRLYRLDRSFRNLVSVILSGIGLLGCTYWLKERTQKILNRKG